MKKVYVRWLGAFAGREYSLKESISFEMARKDEAACEPLIRANHRFYTGVGKINQIGLIIRNEAIFREFHSDIWSYYGQDTKKKYSARRDENPNALYVGRSQNESNHAEAWVKMNKAVAGIVVYGSICELRKDKRNALLNAARKYNLPIYDLNRKGELIERRF